MDTTAAMGTSAGHWPIRGGMTVYGADGDKVGRVTAVSPAYLTVEQGFFVTTDYYAPTSAIAAVGAREIHLTVPLDEVITQGWDLKPADWDTTAYAEAEVLAAEYVAASAPSASAPPRPVAPEETDDIHYIVVAANTASGWRQYDAFVRRLGASPATTALYDPQEIDAAFADLRATRADGRNAVLVILSL